jgi:dolichol-phosphate mannosyltransferase
MADTMVETRRKNPAAETWAPPELAVIVPTFDERLNVSALYDRVAAALAGTPWEMIVVDDDSPDGTASLVLALSREKPNLRCIHRIGRRGLSSACIEGMAATSAPYIAVMDADLQHDESVLPDMLEKARSGNDIIVGSRYTEGGSAGTGLSAARERGSRFATTLSGLLTGAELSDPMSGFFLIRREVFEDIAPSLSGEGFKILLDIIVTATRFRGKSGGSLKIAEVPYTFRSRQAGESKMSPLIVVQFLGLLMSKLARGFLPASFLLFSMVGASGVLVHLAALWVTHERLGFNFTNAQLTATIVAMTTNFILNNELTYADRKLRGLRFWIGLLSFYAVCSVGALANISVAAWIYQSNPDLWIAGITGAAMSVVFNYSVTRVFTWR